MEIEDLKREYANLQRRYQLPDFQKLSEDFEIERVAEKEIESILREIRKTMMDKILSYLRFIELLLNPSNAPILFLALVKNMHTEDKKISENIYRKLGRLEIEAIELDIEYSEKNEAEFIKKLYSEWQQIKQEIKELIKGLKKGLNQKSEKKNRDYFG